MNKKEKFKLYKNLKFENRYKTKFIQFVHNAVHWVITTYISVGDHQEPVVKQTIYRILTKMDLILYTKGPYRLID
jgi:hypothetical protein